MSIRRNGQILGAMAGGVLVAQAIGCGTTWADYYEPLTDPKLARDAGDAGDAGTGGGGGLPTACLGDPTKDAELVRDECGVFVAASAAPGGDGSRAKPLAKLAEAVKAARAGNKRVYACAEKYEEASTVTIDGTLELFGGFAECGASGEAWAWSATERAHLAGPADEIALVLASGGGSIRVESFDVTAPAATKSGGSSIAVYVEGGKAELVSCSVTASDAKKGGDGADAPSAAAQAGSDGNPGGVACSAGTVDGAALVQNTCGAVFSIGGAGGDGNTVSGGSGDLGLPNNGGGLAGSGDDGTPGWTCDGNGGTGKNGLPGSAGNEGAGAPLASFGTLDASGFVAADGAAGQPGKPGQGGGGGGGVRGSAAACLGNPGNGGASGGSGGSGGCGGLGGGAGKGGGASIALVSANAEVTLTSVKLSAGKGGDGGRGGNPQQGGAGSSGGKGGAAKVAGVAPGCNGGDAGKGGDGGPGGGGRGGHSIGLLVLGAAPQVEAVDTTLGASGKGGPGGTNNMKANQGADGIAEKCWSLETGKACP